MTYRAKRHMGSPGWNAAVNWRHLRGTIHAWYGNATSNMLASSESRPTVLFTLYLRGQLFAVYGS